MNQEGFLKPALIGGVLLGILSAVPVISLFNCFCCAWVIAGGVFAAYLYVKGSPLPVNLGTGALLGLATGAIGAVVDTIFTIPIQIALRGVGIGAAQQVREALDRIPMAPETRDTIMSLFSGTGGVGIFLILLSGIMKLILYAVIAMLGATLGVALFEKRKPGMEPSPPLYQPPRDFPPPPPPPVG